MQEALDEPNTTISHAAMPTWDEHLKWLENRTQRVLLLIEAPTLRIWGLAGFVSLTHNNEIGIRLRKSARAMGIGKKAVRHILKHYDPLPAIPSVRPGQFVANINPLNAASIKLFTGLGARHIQNTYTF